MLAETNPTLSISLNTLEYYQELFNKFIMAKTCFAYWEVQHDSQYSSWPEAVKMDKFIELAWKENYEDDIKSKFIYNLH